MVTNKNSDCNINIILSGATGRMGQAVVQEANKISWCKIVAAICSPDSSHLGKDIGILSGTDGLDISCCSDIAKVMKQNAIDDVETDNTPSADKDNTFVPVVIDFSNPGASITALEAAAVSNIPAICCTTGFSQQQFDKLDTFAKTLPIVVAGNTSVGITLLTHLVEQASKVLGEDWDIEVHDVHHRQKVDAPSGTAILLGQHAAKGANIENDTTQKYYAKPRSDNPAAVRYCVQRTGQVVGEHHVRFNSALEQITLSHIAHDRKLFAQGAIRAARWIVNQPAGIYNMRDVLGI